jgi:hypothetical protein
MKRLGLGAAASMEQPTRHYSWGAAHALDRKHSDLIVLKRLLTGAWVAYADDAAGAGNMQCNRVLLPSSQAGCTPQRHCCGIIPPPNHTVVASSRPKPCPAGDRVDSLYSMLDASYSAYQAFVERYNASGKSLSLMVQVSSTPGCLRTLNGQKQPVANPHAPPVLSLPRMPYLHTCTDFYIFFIS